MVSAQFTPLQASDRVYYYYTGEDNQAYKNLIMDGL